MNDSIKKILVEWNTKTTERQKLQQTYALIACVSLIIAGIISLINYTLGQRLLLVAILALFTLIVNMIIWALLQSLILLKINKINFQVETLRNPYIKGINNIIKPPIGRLN